MTASHTPLPVLAVPVKRDNHDHEALWSNVKIPAGIPLATMPENGTRNAGQMAIEILSLSDPSLAKKYQVFREKLKSDVLVEDEKLTSKGWKKFMEEHK